jgi:hypothetical protein
MKIALILLKSHLLQMPIIQLPAGVAAGKAGLCLLCFVQSLCSKEMFSMAPYIFSCSLNEAHMKTLQDACSNIAGMLWCALPTMENAIFRTVLCLFKLIATKVLNNGVAACLQERVPSM